MLIASATALASACTFGCAALADVGDGVPPKKGEAGYTRWMIGIHAGMLVPFAFGNTFAMYAMEGSFQGRALVAFLEAASAFSLYLMVVLRPRAKSQAGASSGLV
jgi:hypothetical protein